MDKPSLFIVTGLSGAGKTLALKRLEDNGYFCVDNLPSVLLGAFVEQCLTGDDPIVRAALATDGREIAFGLSGGLLEQLDLLGIAYTLLFLDCRDDVLSRRYIEMRRKHPFSGDGELDDAIARERALLMPLRERAHHVIDTSALTPHLLYQQMNELLNLAPQQEMTVVFASFGFKRGVPMDADIVLDMRFLPNPFYVSALRPLSGQDKPVCDYLLHDGQAQKFFLAVEQMLSVALPGFAQTGKQRVMVAFGCTGGRHRSVFSAEEMARRMAGCPYLVRVKHRDLIEEAEQIGTRFSQAPPAG